MRTQTLYHVPNMGTRGLGRIDGIAAKDGVFDPAAIPCAGIREPVVLSLCS